MDLNRQPNERETDYQKRIVTGKMIDKSLADEDYGDLSELVYGERHHSDHCRKLFTGVKKYIEAEERDIENGFVNLDDPDDSEIFNKIELANISLKKERIRLSRQRSELNRMLSKQAQREEIHEIFESALDQKKDYSFSPPIIDGSDNLELAISLTDLHVGADINNEFNIFNTDVLKEMLEDYISQARAIQKTHGAKKCVVWANGDLINGNIHGLAVSNRENVVEMVIAASELISNFLIELAKTFEKVRLCLSPGNHSRSCERKDEEILGERLDLLVEWNVKTKLEQYENIIFDDYKKIHPTMYTVEIAGCQYIGSHGDFDNEAKLGELVKFCASTFDVPIKFKAVLTGHLHHNFVKNVRGTILAQAGGFIGVDEFCLSKRIFGSAEQLILVCDENGINCFYPIRFKNNIK